MNTIFTPQGDRIHTSLYPKLTPKQRVQAEGSASFEDFLEMLVELGKKALPGVIITEEDPDPKTETPVVTVEVVHETPVPGEVKPRIRDTFPTYKCQHQDMSLVCRREVCTNYPQWEKTCGQKFYPPSASEFSPEGESVVVWGQRLDTLVQFNCWGMTPPEAGRLAARFKRFMFTYTGVFRLKGVSDILYSERLRDRTVTKWRDDIFARSLRYRMVFEDLYVQEYEVIRRIAVELSESMRPIVEDGVSFFSGRITII